MRIATWNVNSLNVRLPHLLDFLAAEAPDMVALQETKCPDERFPRVEIEAAGYHVAFAGQKAYNGVALISRTPINACLFDLPGIVDPQRRFLAATIGELRVVNLYVPNGEAVGSEKFGYKMAWLDALIAFLRDELVRHRRLIVLGDFNIAPGEEDTHDPKRWEGGIMCSPSERSRFFELLDLGLIDTVRELRPESALYTWWDYRLNAFARNWGIRIDHVLCSTDLQAEDCEVGKKWRAQERPSDHAPLTVQFAGEIAG